MLRCRPGILQCKLYANTDSTAEILGGTLGHDFEEKTFTQPGKPGDKREPEPYAEPPKPKQNKKSN